MTLSPRQLIRKLSLRVGYHVNIGDFTLRHHHTREPIRLHSFRHKGYWWYGKQREAESMTMFTELIQQGSTVIEAGGHIGYVTLFFRHLVGASGHISVFEPGPNNLPYLHHNAGHHQNIKIMECGLGRAAGTATIYLEHMTGQNNSFIKNFKGARDNGFAKHVTAHHRVPMTTLDDYIATQASAPDFIKVDIEGYELELLLGAQKTLREHQPMWMVEVQDNKERIFSLLRDSGYVLLTPERQVITCGGDLNFNTFCLHKDKHAVQLEKIAATGLAATRAARDIS